MFWACWFIGGFLAGVFCALKFGDTLGVITVGDIGPIFLFTVAGPLILILLGFIYLNVHEDKVLFDFTRKNKEL